MKKLFALLLAFSLLFSCAYAETAEPADPAVPEAETHILETKVYPSYYNGPEPFIARPTITIVDGVADLPYMNVEDCMKLVNGILLFTGGGRYSKLKMTATADEENQVLTITRETGAQMICDFKNKQLIWQDYYAFFMDCNGAYMDQTALSPSMGALKRVRSRDRYGEITTVPLGDYMIPMIAQDGQYLIPLQTLSAFFIYPFCGCSTFFNQEAVIFAPSTAMSNPLDKLGEKLREAGLMTDELRREVAEKNLDETEAYRYCVDAMLKTEEGKQIRDDLMAQYDNSLYKVYAGTSPKGERSEFLCAYGYNELVLEMDMFYGLKAAHDIDDFAMFFAQTGLNSALVDPDPATADQAVFALTTYWLDDLHSTSNCRSYLSDPVNSLPLTGDTGVMMESFSSSKGRLADIRSRYPAACRPYYECGDTAYITFDEFINNPGRAYMDEAEKGTLTDIEQDTISLIHYAHGQITRENSPIKNVVLDLSNNTGGMVIDALYVLGWFLGDAQLSLYNTFSRSAVTTIYRADVNLDGKYDESDTVSDLNLYCLISPVSFSSGNLVPCALKADGRVRLLGQASGGGSCVVGSFSTAWGTAFQCSGPSRLSFQKNGAYYDLDKGVEPHFTINSYEHYYDREALTAFIHNLY